MQEMSPNETVQSFLTKWKSTGDIARSLASSEVESDADLLAELSPA